MQKYDAIIIGSGIGGMTAASTLVNRKFKVLVLESHKILGGYCQNFSRKNFTFYSSVLKTCGEKFKNVVDGIYGELGLEKIEWISFPEFVYVEGDKYILGHEDFLQHLLEKFPNQREGIIEFGDTLMELSRILKKVDEATILGNLKLIDLKDLAYLHKYRQITLKDMVNRCFTDDALKTAVVAMVDGKLHSSIFAFLFTVMFAFRGAKMYQPNNGGFCRVINDFKQFIHKHGGKICLDSRVNKIIVENGSAIGVQCEKGEIYYSDLIISSGDISKTLDMLDEQYIPKKYYNKVNNVWKTSCSCFTVWLGLSKSLEELKLPIISASFYKNDGYNRKIEIIKENASYHERDSIFFTTTPSLDKDCTPEGKSQIVIGMLVGKNFENLWETYGTQYYKDKKKEITDQLIRRVENFLQIDLLPHIESEISATPYTYYKYTMNKNGATEGFEVTPEYINDSLKPKDSPIIDGLYACSQWNDDGGGVVAVMIYSMKVVDTILKNNGKKQYDFLERYFTF